MVCTKALVISAVKFQDTSLIVKCYTHKMGIQSYLLKGILKTGKKSLKTAYFQPLTQLEIIATHRKKHSLEYIKEVKVLYHYQTIFTDMIKNSVAFFLAEINNAVLSESFADEHFYDFLTHYLQWFDIEGQSPNFHLKFLIDLTQFLGFFPSVSSQETTFFDVEDGVFTSEQNGHFLLSLEISSILKTLLQTEITQINTIKTTRQQRNELLEGILKYYEYHLPNFKNPKSVDVLKVLF